MSTELDTNMTEHTASTFYGGPDRGVCMHIGANEQCNSIDLTMEEAAELCNTLVVFIKSEADRRQKLLRDQLAAVKDAERTVFHEIAEIPSNRLVNVSSITVAMVSALCPKSSPTGDNQNDHHRN